MNDNDILSEEEIGEYVEIKDTNYDEKKTSRFSKKTNKN